MVPDTNPDGKWYIIRIDRLWTIRIQGLRMIQDSNVPENKWSEIFVKHPEHKETYMYVGFTHIFIW